MITPVSYDFVLKQSCGPHQNKATGFNVSPLDRDKANAIVDPLVHIENVLILTETVPRSFYQAKVVPIYKIGSKLDPGNYRPVSVLNVLPNILERAVHGQNTWKKECFV